MCFVIAEGAHKGQSVRGVEISALLGPQQGGTFPVVIPFLIPITTSNPVERLSFGKKNMSWLVSASPERSDAPCCHFRVLFYHGDVRWKSPYS